MTDNGTEKKFDVTRFGIEETDSCPSCKRLLKSMVEENAGGFIVGRGGEWICLFCGVMFMPKSKLRKILEGMKQERSRIIKPQFVPPVGMGRG